MKIHFLQHVAFEGPGYLHQWMKENGHEVSFSHLYQEHCEFPDPSRIDALCILGGPMNVDQDHLYPWLSREKRLIKDCISEQKKVLGICLGAQLIASSLGAKVRTAPHQEIGWYKVYPTQAIQAISALNELFESFPTVLHWHGDQFEIPTGCSDLLTSQGNSNQAFLYRGHVLALQFHLEVDKTGVQEMAAVCGKDWARSTYVQSIAEILDGTRHCQENHKLLGQLLEWFLRK